MAHHSSHPCLIVGTSLTDQQRCSGPEGEYAQMYSSNYLQSLPQSQATLAIPRRHTQQAGNSDALGKPPFSVSGSQPMQNYGISMDEESDGSQDYGISTDEESEGSQDCGISMGKESEGSQDYVFGQLTPDPTSREEILRSLNLSERQIDDALDLPTYGIAEPIERFMADGNDIGNLFAYTLGLSSCQLLCLQLDSLGLTQTPPSERRHESNRNSRPQKPGWPYAKNKPEQHSDDPRQQRRKRGGTKRKNSHTQAGSQDSSGPIDLANR